MTDHAKPNEEHEYAITLAWTGAARGATTSYQAYSREHEIHASGKPALRASADAHFHGDASRYNPEDLLVAALSGCHLLSYLAECARAGVHVVAYDDDARGFMSEQHGKMRFTRVVLRPRVKIEKGSNLAKAIELHHKAHEGCYVANSVNFPVINEPTVSVAD
jgi:organic hydroperoxide reductase OsmC/OhrA